MVTHDPVLVEWQPHDEILSIALNRDSARNALTWDMGYKIADGIDQYGDSARCVVLRANGTYFCAGADLDMLEQLGGDGNDETVREKVYGSFQQVVRAIEECPAPIVGRIQGPALGAGADLALTCDIRVASTKAWLEETWIRLGTVSALGGGFTLPRLIGSASALEILLTGRRVDSTEAAAKGIFQRVVEPDELDVALTDIVGAICSADRDAVRAMKRLVSGSWESHHLSEALEVALDEQVPLIARDEFGARVTGILDRIRQRGSDG